MITYRKLKPPPYSSLEYPGQEINCNDRTIDLGAQLRTLWEARCAPTDKSD